MRLPRRDPTAKGAHPRDRCAMMRATMRAVDPGTKVA